MKKTLYAIKDDLSEFASPIAIIARSDDEIGKRYFRKMCETTDIMIGNEDQFSLYKIGYFETETGKITNIEPEFIERGVKTHGNTIQNERKNPSDTYTGRE